MESTSLKKDLLAKGYRVIVPDLRGNGESDKPYSPESYAHNAETKDLMSLTNHLELDSYVAIGYSRGSIVLAKLITRAPKIRKAVMGGMGLDFTNPNWDRRIMFQKAFSGEDKLNSITRGAAEYAQSKGLDLKILSFLQEFQPVTSITELKNISIEVMVIAGNEDPRALKDCISKGQLQIINGNHNDSYKSDDFSQQVIEFLENKERAINKGANSAFFN